MGDNRRRHLAIREQLTQMCPNATGRQKQGLLILAALISGLVASRQSNLSSIASKVPEGTKRESQIKRFSRWLANDKSDHQLVFLPFAKALLESLAHCPLVLVMDGSQVGQGGMALVLSVVYKGRALPLGWLVVKAKKGHLAEKYHIKLLKQVKPLIPEGSRVIFLGDGEFDGCRLLRRLDYYGWDYVCRTAKNSRLWIGDDCTNFAGLHLAPGDLVSIPQAAFSLAEYGPLTAIGVWEKDYQEPLYLITKLALAEEAVNYYKKRFKIETFFSDSKTRGFNLHRSHLRDPKRLERLLLAACLAYLWIVYLGTLALAEGWNTIIHRTDRLDLSLFNLGLALLEHFLNELLPLPLAFVPLEFEAR
jgi:hypothetical protein